MLLAPSDISLTNSPKRISKASKYTTHPLLFAFRQPTTMPPRASPAPAPDTRTPSSVTKRQSPSSILPPTISSTYIDFEYSVHNCPRQVLRDIPIIFPDLRSRPTATVLLIPTVQRASVDLVTYGDEQAVEKDRLLARFVDWATKVRSAVARLQPDAWTDITDPASGVAYFGTAGACYSDVEGIVKTRKLSTIDCGGCRVAKHPEWGFAMYPATLFSTANNEIIKAALEDVNGQNTVSKG